MWRTGLVAPRHVGSSRTRARTRVPCIGRWVLNHCATWETPSGFKLNPFAPLGLWIQFSAHTWKTAFQLEFTQIIIRRTRIYRLRQRFAEMETFTSQHHRRFEISIRQLLLSSFHSHHLAQLPPSPSPTCPGCPAPGLLLLDKEPDPSDISGRAAHPSRPQPRPQLGPQQSTARGPQAASTASKLDSDPNALG